MTTLNEVRDSGRATITIKDAAAILAVDPRTVSGALSVHGGTIPSLSVGRRIVIPLPAFLRWYDGDQSMQAPSTSTADEPRHVPAVDTAAIRSKLLELLGALEGGAVR